MTNSLSGMAKETISIVDNIPICIYNKSNIGATKYPVKLKDSNYISFTKRLLSDYVKGTPFKVDRLTEIRGNTQHTIKAEITLENGEKLTLFRQLDFLIMPKYTKEIRDIMTISFPHYQLDKIHVGFDTNEFAHMPILYVEIRKDSKRMLVRLDKGYFSEEHIAELLKKKQRGEK